MSSQAIVNQKAVLDALRVLLPQRIPVLLVGPPGTGKTLIGLYALSWEGGRVLRVDCGQTTQLSPHHLFGKAGILLDEIHCLKTPEAIYPLLTENKVTIIGTTTDEGLLPEALRSRFFTLCMQPYTLQDLTTIAMSYGLDRTTAGLVAEASRGIPRRVVQFAVLLRFTVPHTRDTFYKTLAKFGWPLGLSYRELTYLRTVARKPTSLSTLCGILQAGPETVRSTEAFLISAGLVEITSRGRSITPTGLAILQEAEQVTS